MSEIIRIILKVLIFSFRKGVFVWRKPCLFAGKEKCAITTGFCLHYIKRLQIKSIGLIARKNTKNGLQRQFILSHTYKTTEKWTIFKIQWWNRHSGCRNKWVRLTLRSLLWKVFVSAVFDDPIIIYFGRLYREHPNSYEPRS